MTDMPPPGDDPARFPRPDSPAPAGPPRGPDRSPTADFSSGDPSRPATSPPQAVPAGYSPFGQQPTTPTEPRSGRLLAGGIVAVVLSVLIGLLGLVLLLVGAAVDDLVEGFGGVIRVVGLLVLVFAGFGAAGGVGAILRRNWGRICSIVFGAINLVFALLSLVGNSDGRGSTLVYLALSGAIVLLCATGPAST